MNTTHLHLLINHLAVIGAFLGIIVLIFALSKNTTNTYYAAYTILIISAVGGAIAYLTGESAEETVEGISGIAESAIEPHEDSALVTTMSFLILGILAIISTVVSYGRNGLQKKMGIAVLVIGIISFSLAARTAWLGGKIRHTEISGTGTTINTPDKDGD